MNNPAPADVSISLTLPMYANAREEQGTNNQQPPEYPAVSDLYEGASNVFLVPLNKQDAETWFTNQLTSIGYSLYASGCFGNTLTRTSTDEYSFKKIKNPDVYVAFAQNYTKYTIAQYFGEYIIPPPRPADSLLPNTIQEIDIGYSLLDSSGTFASKPMVIKDSSTIQKVNKRRKSNDYRHGHFSLLPGHDSGYKRADGKVSNIFRRYLHIDAIL